MTCVFLNDELIHFTLIFEIFKESPSFGLSDPVPYSLYVSEFDA